MFPRKKLRLLRNTSTVLFLLGLLLLADGVVKTYSSRRYLKGFADAIVPLDGSAEEKTRALLGWFRHTPSRSDTIVQGASDLRDPVNIVQNEHLLKICGSASNAFLNLADAGGLTTRRLLLLAPSGGTAHVVVEVKWDDRWVVVDPQHAAVFTDATGRPLTRDELHDPAVFQHAISRIPGYSPSYTFTHTAHLHLRRIPFLGALLERMLNRFSPGWDNALDWGYVPENPSLWPILLSLPLLLLAVLLRFAGRAYMLRRPEAKAVALHEIARA